MGVDVGGTAANVLVGSAILRVAPIGTDLPDLDGTSPIVWDAAWKKCGYTEDGCKMTYSPTYKDIKVDEEMAPVKIILTDEAATIEANLAEATLNNMALAISASKLDESAKVAAGGKAGFITLKFGSGEPVEMLVSLEGVSPAGMPRVIVGYRAMARANVSMQYKKADMTVLPVQFTLLADSSKALGERLAVIMDHVDAP